MAMATIFGILEAQSHATIRQLSIVMVFLLGVAQYLVGARIDVSPFFVLPVLINSWYGNSRTGFFVAFLSVLTLFVARAAGSSATLTSFYSLLTVLPHFLAYLIFTMLVINFRNTLRIQVNVAETDGLTGIHNARSFRMAVTSELARSRRYSHVFSLAYIDVDDFKSINDLSGHAAGDRLLIEVAKCLVSSLRESDVVARLGGDEYACLLPETSQDEARKAFVKTIFQLKQCAKRNQWPVSFSIGVITFAELPADADQAIGLADRLMYSVKRHHKDDIFYQVFSTGTL